MFGLFKRNKKQSISSALETFLEEADDAYILAFKSKNIKPFTPFAEPEVCTKVLEKVFSEDELCFGIERYRIRTWLVQEKTDSTITVLKEVTHKNIQLGRGLEIPIADDVKQRWLVSILDGGCYRIVRIESA